MQSHVMTTSNTKKEQRAQRKKKQGEQGWKNNTTDREGRSCNVCSAINLFRRDGPTSPADFSCRIPSNNGIEQWHRTSSKFPELWNSPNIDRRLLSVSSALAVIELRVICKSESSHKISIQSFKHRRIQKMKIPNSAGEAARPNSDSAALLLSQ